MEKRTKSSKFKIPRIKLLSIELLSNQDPVQNKPVKSIITKEYAYSASSEESITSLKNGKTTTLSNNKKLHQENSTDLVKDESNIQFENPILHSENNNEKSEEYFYHPLLDNHGGDTVLTCSEIKLDSTDRNNSILNFDKSKNDLNQNADLKELNSDNLNNLEIRANIENEFPRITSSSITSYTAVTNETNQDFFLENNSHLTYPKKKNKINFKISKLFQFNKKNKKFKDSQVSNQKNHTESNESQNPTSESNHNKANIETNLRVEPKYENAIDNLPNNHEINKETLLNENYSQVFAGSILEESMESNKTELDQNLVSKKKKSKSFSNILSGLKKSLLKSRSNSPLNSIKTELDSNRRSSFWSLNTLNFPKSKSVTKSKKTNPSVLPNSEFNNNNNTCNGENFNNKQNFEQNFGQSLIQNQNDQLAIKSKKKSKKKSTKTPNNPVILMIIFLNGLYDFLLSNNSIESTKIIINLLP